MTAKAADKSNELVTMPVTAVAPVSVLSADQIQLLKDTIAKGATNDELKLFVEVCRRKNLDPFTKQIHAIKRWDSTLKREVITFQIGIDGFRVIAERTGKYEGQEGPFWCGTDGAWVDIWTEKTPPAAAKVGVFRKGFRQTMWSAALYPEYVQLTQDGKPNSMWRKMPAAQLAKCAEALALRKAFPEELSGLYAHEEMPQPEAPPQEPQGNPAPEARPAAPALDMRIVPEGLKLMQARMLSIREVCDAFGELKARLIKAMGPAGETEYYRLLKQYGGVEHANALRRPGAREASFAMWTAIEQAEALRQPDGGDVIEGEFEEPAAAEREPGDGE